MNLLENTIERILSVKTDIQLKAIAIIIFAVIAIMMCVPIASGSSTEFSAEQLGVIFLCVSGIIVVILSDRIVSLKFSKDKLNIKLAEIKESMNETIKEVEDRIVAQPASPTPSPPPATPASEEKPVASPAPEPASATGRLKEAKELISRPPASDRMDDMLKDAENIGLAMGMLGEVLKTYKRAQDRSEGGEGRENKA